MPINSCADVTLGANSEAWAVLHMLAQKEPDFADFKDGRYQVDIRTVPWYNCRERGFCLIMSPDFVGAQRESLHVCFARHRNTDDITIYWWIGVNREGGAPIIDIPVDNFLQQKECKTVNEAVDWIYNLLGIGYKQLQNEPGNRDDQDQKYDRVTVAWIDKIRRGELDRP